MSLTSSSTRADAIAQYNDNLNWEGSAAKAVLALEAVRFLLINRPQSLSESNRSLSYEIQDDEVVVRVGIITQAVKHVPYRTVTNLTIKRGLLDRWLFDIGTLNIQTAGMSGTTGAEESLVGLPNVQEVYEIVATELRRFRGGMAPTAAEVESEPGTAPTHELGAILAEVRAIRQALERA